VTSPRFDTDVAIVGYGPTGEVLAGLLGARGWRVDVFERALDVVHQPRAVHFDAEVMRVFQQLGVVDAIHPAIAPVQGMDLLNGAGDVIFRFRARAGDGPLGWPDGFMFYQPDVERALRSAASRCPSVTAHLGQDVVAVANAADDSAAILNVRPIDRRGVSGDVRTIRARFAVGCCGARSVTRAAIGSPLFDYGLEQPWLVLDLIVRRDAGLPKVTVQYCDPAHPATYVMMPGHRCRFELMLMPGDTPDTMLDPSHIATRLAPWIRPEDYDIDRAAIYVFHGLVAEQWRRGRLLIAGDAVHQMPPFLGQGMCSGVRDAANLAWKLDLVLSGIASDTLLDTYQEEREPHVRRLIETDMYLGALIQTTDPEVARQRDMKATNAGAPTALTPSLPRLGGRLCGVRADCGVPFPQPVLADGRRYDEQIGDRFALVGAVTPSAWAARILDRIGTRIVTDPASAITEWLHAHDAVAAVVRPDRNVLALVSNPAELDQTLGPLAAHLVPADA
jgi:3-(3-hydroxy-phenyl)propionate hydroxylase